MNALEINVNNNHASDILAAKLYDICKNYSDIVFVFIGTDCNMGDSLGPLCGEMSDIRAVNKFFYGSLSQTITAKDVPFLSKYIQKAHPSSFIVAVDAALGTKNDIGKIKIADKGIKPGLGVNKVLPIVGNASIIGVVGEKTDRNGMTTVMRLSDIFRMSRTISAAIGKFIALSEDKKLKIV